MAPLLCGSRQRLASVRRGGAGVTVVAATAALLLRHFGSASAEAGAALVPPAGKAWAQRASATSKSSSGGQGRREVVGAGWLASVAAPLARAEEARSPRVGGEAVTLSNGLVFPKASFGLQIYDDSTAQSLTETALAAGFRNFFASVLAGNQVGFARGVKASGVPREELFICGTVLSNSARGFQSAYELTKRGCDENLQAFAKGDISYVDMIMLDYPGKNCESIRGQWKAFEEMLASGKTRSLAVSNFSPEQLDCVLTSGPSGGKPAGVPVVNQLPFGVTSFDPAAVSENAKRGIIVQAWSPLSNLLGSARKSAEKIGQAYGKSAYQVALRWIVQSGATYSMQTKSKAHFEEDLNIFDFKLTEAEMQQLSSLRR